MKQNTTNTNNNTTNQSQHNYTGKHNRPQNKDDMDSREGEEQDNKGDDVTHNKRETKEHHLHNHNK